MTPSWPIVGLSACACEDSAGVPAGSHRTPRADGSGKLIQTSIPSRCGHLIRMPRGCFRFFSRKSPK